MARAGFSFEEDFAPMRGEYFGGLTAYGAAKQAALDRDTALQIAEIQEQARSRDMAFQQQQMLLNRQIEDTRRQRDAFEKIPEVTQGITSILDDPAKDDATKAADITRLKINYAPFIAVEPSLSGLFATAENQVEARQKEKERTNGLANALMQTGQTEALKTIAKDWDSPEAGKYIVAAEAIASARKAESESRRAADSTKLAQEQAEKLRTGEMKYLDDYTSFLRTLDPMEDEGEDMAPTTLKGGKQKTTPVKKARPFEFAPQDRIILERMFRDLNPAFEDQDISGKVITDEKLFRDVLKSVSSRKNRLMGTDSGFDSSAFSRSK